MKSISTVSINDIQIGERHRQDLGDINGLAQSIADDGLLQPIGITPDNRLVFGYRRLVAFRDVLNRSEIPAVVIDIENLTHAEWIENTIRKNLTCSEMVAITDALRSFSRGGDRCSEQYRKNVIATTKKQACEIAGWKLDKFDDAKKVVEKGVPELVQLMDEEKVSLHAAAQLAGEPAEIQREAVKKLEQAMTAAERRGIVRAVRRIKNAKNLAERRKAELDACHETDAVRLYHCPFQELADVAHLKPESAQCILTDIPYDGQFINQLGELARFAAEVLVDGGVFVCYVGQHRLNEKLRIFDEHLTYQWMGTSRWVGQANSMHTVKVVSNSTPFLIYTKGERKKDEWVKWLDTLEFDQKEKDCHPWQKPVAEIETLLRYFTKPNDLVIDPCGGGFTTAVACHRLGRKCVSCDVEKAYVVRGLERLAGEKAPSVEQDDSAPVDADFSLVEVAA